jgi:hypothetical protein
MEPRARRDTTKRLWLEPLHHKPNPMAILEPAPGKVGEIRPPTRDEAFLPIAAYDGRGRRVTLLTGAVAAFVLGLVCGCIWNYLFYLDGSDPHEFFNPSLGDFPFGDLKSSADNPTRITAVRPLAIAADREIEIKFKGIVPAKLPHEVGAAIQITNKGPSLKALFVKCLALTEGGDPIGFGIKQATEIPRNAVVFDEVPIDTGGRKQARVECHPATRW